MVALEPLLNTQAHGAAGVLGTCLALPCSWDTYTVGLWRRGDL